MNNNTSQEWNMFVAENGGSLRQSWEWGEFQRALGREVIRWKSADEALAAQIIRQPLPFGRNYFYIPRGPITLNQNLNITHSTSSGQENKNDNLKLKNNIAELINYTRGIAKKAIFLRVEPGFSRDDPAVTVLRELGFSEVRSGVQPQETLLIDLTKSEDELLVAMHHKTRYNIRLAERHSVTVSPFPAIVGKGDTVRERGSETFAALWPMFAETARRDKFAFHSQQYYQTMLDLLRPKDGGNQFQSSVIAREQGDRGNLKETTRSPRPQGGLAMTPRVAPFEPYGYVCLWVAEQNGIGPLAAAIIGYFGSVAVYLHGASSSQHRNMMAPYLLHWHIMQDAKGRGYATYDFGGISEKQWPGVTRFKRGFGGQPFYFAGVFDLPCDRLWYTMYRVAHALRKPYSRTIHPENNSGSWPSIGEALKGKKKRNK